MANYETKFWNSFVPFLSQRDFIQMHLKINVDETILELQKAKSEKRIDKDGMLTIDFLKKKADETKLYAKETIWPDNSEVASKTAQEHMPRAKAENPF